MSGQFVTEAFDYDGGGRASLGAVALRDAGADVVMTERVGAHGDAFWFGEFPLMVAWAFRRFPGGGGR